MQDTDLKQQYKSDSGKITGEMNPDVPFLGPIDEPADKELKITFENMRKFMGKVITPLKVFSARMPIEFTIFYTKIGELDNKLTIPNNLALLIRSQVARLNVCLFCMDSSRFALLRSSMKPEKINDLSNYKTSPFYSKEERSALDYATQLTTEKKVSKELFLQLQKHFSDQQICEIVYLIASEHINNLTNIGLNIHSDMLCNLSWKNL